MPQHAGGGALERAQAVAGVPVGTVLAVVAALRRGKPVHPAGAAYDARLRVTGSADAPAAGTLLSTPGEHRAVVRFSRSLGLPQPIPDLLGISIRIPDVYGPRAHQDFLLVSSVDVPILHHVFLPARDVQQRPYSSSLPYRAGDRLFLVGVLPRSDSPRPSGRDELERASRAAATGALRFDLATAALSGRFIPVAELRIGAPLPPEADALRFNPFNSGGGLKPAGFLNAMRRYAYPLSQAAWRRARPGAARAQEVADRLVAHGVVSHAARLGETSEVAGRTAVRHGT